MINLPEVKMGIVAVSRDCFPASLSQKRLDAVLECARQKEMGIFAAKTVVENETDAVRALNEIKAGGVNALVVYLGNFGPEGPETQLAQKFDGPVMFMAAAEESGNDLINGRGDAYCGMLNASYNLNLRGRKAYIPQYPVGTPSQVVKEISLFTDIARVIIGVPKLKIFSFGPRPYDFLACNAPIKPLYDLGVEIQENSELDLFAYFNKHADDDRIGAVMKEMEEELGEGNKHPGVLRRLAQYEISLLDWARENKGASEFFVFANKCWPAFQTQFGFVPCYVNGRLAKRGIPVACETDIYGALTEYVICLATLFTPTLLDINNTVPQDMYNENKKAAQDYRLTEMFMGFHCGNTAAEHLVTPEMSHQLIMKRALEPDSEPDITRGTLEGRLKPDNITLFRIQSSADCKLKSYIAEGNILDINPKSFGSIGVIGIPEMERFYRHVLIEGNYPHHAGVAFKFAGKVLFEAMRLLGISDISFNQPRAMLYKSENPFVLH